MTRTFRDLQTVVDCLQCGDLFRRRVFLSGSLVELCKTCRPRARREPMSDREKQIRDWLKSLTPHELHLLKSKWIHDEQMKRRGIVITPKQQQGSDK